MIKAFQDILQLLRPPQWGSWQTFICVAIGLFLGSFFAADLLRESLAIASFSALTVGLTWVGLEKSWLVTPWMTAALVLMLIYGLFPLVRPTVLVVLWPPFAALLWLLSHCFDVKNSHFYSPNTWVRQRFLIIFGVQLLLSCWFQFHFTVQGWIDRYPSLLVDDFQDSLFVAKTINSDRIKPRGWQILQAIYPTINDRLNQQDWAVMEPWLRSLWVPHQLPDYIPALLQELQVLATPEDPLWIITATATPRTTGYELIWRANWEGPRSRRSIVVNPYTSEMHCTIVPVERMTAADCKPPFVVIQGQADDNLTAQPWWQRLRLLPRALDRNSGDTR